MILFFILLALCCEAFFSGSETAFVSVNFMKLTHLIEKKNKRAMLVHGLLKKPDRLLATTLVGTNLSVVASAALATALFAKVSLSYSALLATIVMTPISFVFCELLPKTIFRYNANRIVLVVAPPFCVIQKIFLPLTFFVSFFANSVAKIINPRQMRRNPFLTKDEIKSLIKDISREGILEEHEKDAIDQIFEFTLTKSQDIMVPLEKVISIDIKESAGSIKEKCRHYGFTRFPVFEDRRPKGIINIFDIFYARGQWQNLIRPLERVSAQESVDTIFSKMQPSKQTMTAVFSKDEMIGILTMEDLIEDISSKLISGKKG